MSLKVWKTLHVQKQTRSNVSSHRDTRMGNATVWLTTMQSFVDNFAAICFWDYAQQSAMCGARRQHHVATSRCKILFDRLVVKKLFWPCISRSKQAFSRQSSNHEVQHFDPTQALFSDCLMLFASGTALGTQCKQLLLDFLLGPQWTLSCITQGLLDLLVMPCEAARKPRQHTQTVCPQAIKGCTQKGFKFQKQTYCTRLGRLAACQTFKLSRLGAVVIINLSTCYAIVTPMECFCD